MLIFHFGLYQFNITTVLYDIERNHVNFHQNITSYTDWYMIKTQMSLRLKISYVYCIYL